MPRVSAPGTSTSANVPPAVGERSARHDHAAGLVHAQTDLAVSREDSGIRASGSQAGCPPGHIGDRRADFLVGLLAEHADDLGEPLLACPAGDTQVVAGRIEDPEVGRAPRAILQILLQGPPCGHDPVVLSGDVIYLKH
jgi:hypothetical protein